mmetsp:Transcript_29552/g.28743  ORF Transcript_29552/g.28743 Transcript_29552/m.28743 type:complete len:161 (+) Transcript_29552:358-840(+)
MQALIQIYIDSEKTSYHEKFSFRYNSSLIMEYVWSDPGQRKNFADLGVERPGLFVEFCNFLINDLNNLLFEGLILLEKIKEFEERSSTAEWQALDNETKQFETENHEQNKKQAKGEFQLSNMIVLLLAKVTSNFVEPFISEELGESFANALNYSLDSLVS